MPSLIVRARLFGGDETPLAQQIVTVQTFDLSARRWQNIMEAQSRRDGQIEASLDLRTLSMGKLGPALRLTEGDQEKRVLSPGPMLSLQGRERNVLADFGEIEVLGEAAYPRPDAEGNEATIVAGVVRKKGLPQATIIRGIERDPDLRAIVAGDGTLGDRASVVTDARPRANVDPRLTAEIETMHAINLDNTAKLAEKDRLLATREHELSLKTTELQTALARASDAENRLAAVKTASRGEPADIDAVVTNIGSRIGAASATLRSADNPFRIGAIRLDLKGSLADDGRIFLGGDKADGSGFSIDLSPEGESTRGDVQVTVPDVTGLTQSAARRVLRSVGLRLTAATQSVTAGSATHGHSLRQTPAAGSTAAHGSNVVVVFAKVT
jgi:hypothetical protein